MQTEEERMKNLWHVTFDAKYTGLGDLIREEVKVVENDDGLRAVAKARRQIVGSTFEDGPVGSKWVTRKCRWVKLTGLELLHSIDA
jgi:hypothetical protein